MTTNNKTSRIKTLDEKLSDLDSKLFETLQRSKELTKNL